jgi:GDP-4-dehydro-6-deoxy-D-mannose reductase
VKTLFVSGAEGFVGQQLVKLLVEKGYDVVGGVRNRARKLAFEKQYGRALVCEVGDAINVARVIASVKPDGVIHLAGGSLPHVANDEPLDAYQSIVTAWANVLDAVRRSAPRARVLMVSSSEVYGQTATNGQPIDENTPCNPTSTFGALKLAAESMAHTYYGNYHLNVSIARPFGVLGPDQPVGTFFGWVTQRVADWEASSPESSLGVPDLNCRRDVLHVLDVARAYNTLLEHGTPNEAYNVCSGESRTVREICETMIRAAGKRIALRDEAENQAPTGALIGDGSKLQALGWRPTRSFEQAVTDLVDSYQGAPVPAT